MFDTIQFRIFFAFPSPPYKTIILPLFCMGVKLGLSHYGNNIDWGWDMGVWGRVLRRVCGPKWDEV